MKVIFDDLANEEFNDAVEYYEFQVAGLGKKFKAEISRALRTHHVAIATVSSADMIVSWNFKHIVHYDKIRHFNEVNAQAGYTPIQIFCPWEVI